MIRETSIEAYKKIKEEGLLSQKRFETYEALIKHGPCTSSELFMKITPTASHVFGNIRSRLNELKILGVVTEKQIRPCKVTGFNVIEWDVTDKIPVKSEKIKRSKCSHCEGRGYFFEKTN